MSEITSEDIRRTLRALTDEECDALDKYLRIWERGLAHAEGGPIPYYMFFRQLRRWVEDERIERRRGVRWLHEADLMKLLATLSEHHKRAAAPAAASHFGSVQFWACAALFVDDEKRRRWADQKPGTDPDIQAQVEEIFKGITAKPPEES